MNIPTASNDFYSLGYLAGERREIFKQYASRQWQQGYYDAMKDKGFRNRRLRYIQRGKAKTAFPASFR